MRSKRLKNIPAFLIQKSLTLVVESLEDVKKVTRELDISKASQPLDIATKIIKQNADIFLNCSLSILVIY